MKLVPGVLYEYRPLDNDNNPFGMSKTAIYLGYHTEHDCYYEAIRGRRKDSWAVYRFIDIATGKKYTIEIGLEPWSKLSSGEELIIFDHYQFIPV